MKGGKMSKSKGNVFYPDTIINRYGLDALRYFASTCIPFGNDGLFTPDLFIDNFNNDLVNNYGNLLNRTVSMVSKYFGGTIPAYQGIVTEFDQKLEDDVKEHFDNYEKYFNNFEVDKALKEAFAMLSKANKYIDDTKPWALAKEEDKKNELASVMTHLSLIIKAASILLSPMLVETPAKAFAQLGVEDTSYENALDYNTVSNKQVSKGEVLFPRLDPKVELEYFESQMPDI
jgi:methionyl-tRNA synthetase